MVDQTKQQPTDLHPGGKGNALDSLKKVFNGFCVPEADEDDDTVTSLSETPLVTPRNVKEAKSNSSSAIKKNTGASTAAATTTTTTEEKPVTSETTKKPKESKSEKEAGDVNETTSSATATDAAAAEATRNSIESDLKASHAGTRHHRVKRGLETTAFAILAVIATIFALQHFGYELDMKVVETQLRSEQERWLNIVVQMKDDFAGKKNEINPPVVSETAEEEKEEEEEAVVYDQSTITKEVVEAAIDTKIQQAENTEATNDFVSSEVVENIVNEDEAPHTTETDNEEMVVTAE